MAVSAIAHARHTAEAEDNNMVLSARNQLDIVARPALNNFPELTEDFKAVSESLADRIRIQEGKANESPEERLNRELTAFLARFG